MSKKSRAAPPGVALSPYLSLRQAVRPAIFAHSLLAREQGRAEALADEANQILALTRDLLKGTGLVHILTPEPSGAITIGESGDRKELLLETFADAGMLWAKILGTCYALAEILLEQAQWEQVRKLAGILENAGEAGVAQYLRERLANGVRAVYKARLETIHGSMTLPETKKAVETLMQGLSEIPLSGYDYTWVNRFLPELATSALRHLKRTPGVPLAPPVALVQAISSGHYRNEPYAVPRLATEIADALRIAT